MGLSEGGTPVGMSPKTAADFVGWFINKFGRGALGPQSWQAAKALWLKESGHATYGDSLKEYYPEASWDTYVNWVTSGQWNDTTPTDTTTTPTETIKDPDTGEDVTVVDAFPDASVSSEGDKVYNNGIYYIFRNGQWIADQYDDIVEDVDDPPGDPADNSTIEDITVTGTQPEGFDWSSLLSGLGGISGIASLLGWEGLGGGDDKELSWWEKLFELVKSKKAIDDYNKYQVPTGQMASQSAVGKDWGLPSKESMVMQGLGPNYLQGQKYAMNKGAPMPAATHVGGLPLVEEIEGGEQGGIMGLKSHGDITPAFLEPGEFVFTKKAADNIGAKRLYKLMKQAEQMGMR